MESISHKLKASPGWVETNTNIVSKPFCLGMGIDCDSMFREYRTDNEVTREEIQSIIDNAGLKMEIVGDCRTPLPSKYSSTSNYVCKAHGVSNGYEVGINVVSYNGYNSHDEYNGIGFYISATKNHFNF